MNDTIGSQGIFSQSLQAASGANPFCHPSLPPGERALDIEAQFLRCEGLISARAAEALQHANLTRSESEAVIARLVAFLSSRSVAGRLGTPMPDTSEMFADLDALLAQFGAVESQRAEVLDSLPHALDNTPHRRAA